MIETCPRCAGQLTKKDNAKVESIWRVNKEGVVILCHLRLTELVVAFCPVCYFQEVISLKKNKFSRPFSKLVSFMANI